MSDRFARTLDIFIGFDPGEAVAYHACANSIIRNASQPVRITPLALGMMAPFYVEKHNDGSTEFAYSRFLVPYLCGYLGSALFIDGDMIVKDDIAKLFDDHYADMYSAVSVVKHPEYVPNGAEKFRGASQQAYPRKNWSSVMLFRCSHFSCKRLTPEFVTNATGAQLHQFSWVEDERIGSLDPTWNWLVDEAHCPHNPDAKLLHYTRGVPAFAAYANCDHASDWWDEFHRMTNVNE